MTTIAEAIIQFTLPKDSGSAVQIDWGAHVERHMHGSIQFISAQLTGGSGGWDLLSRLSRHTFSLSEKEATEQGREKDLLCRLSFSARFPGMQRRLSARG